MHAGGTSPSATWSGSGVCRRSDKILCRVTALLRICTPSPPARDARRKTYRIRFCNRCPFGKPRTGGDAAPQQRASARPKLPARCRPHLVRAQASEEDPMLQGRQMAGRQRLLNRGQLWLARLGKVHLEDRRTIDHRPKTDPFFIPLCKSPHVQLAMPNEGRSPVRTLLTDSHMGALVDRGSRAEKLFFERQIGEPPGFGFFAQFKRMGHFTRMLTGNHRLRPSLIGYPCLACRQPKDLLTGRAQRHETKEKKRFASRSIPRATRHYAMMAARSSCPSPKRGQAGRQAARRHPPAALATPVFRARLVRRCAP